MHAIFTQMNDFFISNGTQGLFLNSFIESFFLVPPPDILLIAMDLLDTKKAMFYAFICTIASVLGGMVGYGIGYWGGRPVFEFLFRKQHDGIEKIEAFCNKYGYAAGFLGAFSPFPYKIFTIASGILKLNFLIFVLTGFIGRGMRFFIVSTIIMFFGELFLQYIKPIVAIITITVIVFFILVYKKRKSFI
jgi:undecaprenyl-diphosphatase